jgi:hypothetical protein
MGLIQLIYCHIQVLTNISVGTLSIQYGSMVKEILNQKTFPSNFTVQQLITAQIAYLLHTCTYLPTYTLPHMYASGIPARYIRPNKELDPGVPVGIKVVTY